MAFKDITGQRFGRLVAIERHSHYRRSWVWLCRCDCGKESKVVLCRLTGGHTKSCGCLISETSRRLAKALKRPANLKHGHARRGIRTTEYQSFCAAKSRCENTRDDQYPDYGGRGIRFMFRSFDVFLASIGEKPKGTSLDRIDNAGNYEPGNCRWATPKEQANNRRHRRWKKRPEEAGA